MNRCCQCCAKCVRVICQQGSQGAQGEQGVAGESAYQVAVNNGFIGTESEWLLSLKGAKGEKGDSGDSELIALHMQSKNNADTIVQYMVPFDTVISDFSKGQITQNSDGSFLLNGKGIYKVDWNMNVDGADSSDIEVTLVYENGLNIKQSGFEIQGEISGSALIYATQDLGTLSVIVSNPVNLAQVATQTNIVIRRIYSGDVS